MVTIESIISILTSISGNIQLMIIFLIQVIEILYIIRLRRSNNRLIKQLKEDEELVCQIRPKEIYAQ